MSEFVLPATPCDQAWLDLQARLAHAAHAMHCSAASGDAANSAALLVIAGNLASLAIGFPASRAAAVSYGPVDAATLLATQVLQLYRPAGRQALLWEFDD